MVDRDPDEAAVNDAVNQLEEAGKVETEYAEGEEPQHSLTEHGEEYMERRLAESADHQLFLLQLHWNYSCVEQPTTKQTIAELFGFAETFRDDHGVNILRVWDDHRDQVETDPIPEFAEPTLRRFDP
jgi:DNA-binding PadR family transcriptional regulator